VAARDGRVEVSARAAKRLALVLLALTVALLVGAVATGTRPGLGDWLSSGFAWAIALVFSSVGALIAIRRPGNAIGWIFLWTGMTAGVAQLAHGYANYWTAGRGGSEAVGEAAAWYASLSWIPFILVPATFLLLLFPDGRLVSPRWRAVAWCAALGIGGVFFTTGLTPGRLEDYPQLANPYDVDSAVLEPLTGLCFLTLGIGIVGSSVSLIVRFRRATGEQRLQIKWLAFAGAIVAVTLPVATVGFDLWADAVSNTAIMMSVLGLPVAAGVAILRHRLYDIDVVINRTLVYGALTATLAGAYLASVLLLQLVLSPSSDLAIAASTLAVAALFRPARSRIQGLVDRRFYRRKYDAQRTLETFSARLRDEVSLDALGAELRGVVAETVQPAHVSLWLRPRMDRP
jgi:hypothetical protein